MIIQVLLYIDLHGHSRKQNVFTYGCHTPHCDHNQFLNERVFPFLLSRQVKFLVYKSTYSHTLINFTFASSPEYLASRAASILCSVAKSPLEE